MDVLEIQNTKYELVVASTHEGLREVLVTFQYKKKEYRYSIFLKDEGNVDYIAKAKERFEIDAKTNKIKKFATESKKNNNKIPVIGACVLGALAVVFASLFTWKVLTNNPGGGGDTPVIDEATTTLTYSYSPYHTEEGFNKLTISFETPKDSLNPEDPPFVGDVYVQWNKDDASTKEKIEAGTKTIEFDYKAKYANINPTEFTVVITGDVKTFVARADDYIGNNNISSINFGKSIRRIYQGAFTEIENLNYVHIGGQVRMIEASAFSDCINLRRVDFSTIDETDRLDIAHATFMGCNNLRTINFPKRLTYFGPVKECRNLEQITIPEENQYFTTLHKDENNQVEDCGVVVTKAEVKSPFEFEPHEEYEDPDFPKDAVVASTNNPYIYEGIKAVFSLSGVDIHDLRIPASVELINGHDVAASRIDYIHVARGNKRFTDLYQSEIEEDTANVLAELNDENELKIIKVANEATPINETGRIYIDGEPQDFPVTAFDYGAATNSSITSLDLPATLKTFSFDDYMDQGFLDHHHTNPFFTTLTDLTIRAITPPTYVESRLTTHHINEVFGEERTDKVAIHLPIEAFKNYCYHLDPKEPEPSPGYWNLSNTGLDPKNIRFTYNTIDSEGLASRKEAREWVKTHYTQRNRIEYAIINKWDFTPLIEAKEKSSIYLYGLLQNKIKDINANSYDINSVISFSPLAAASCNPNGMQDFRNVQITPLNAGNFDAFFKTFTPDETPQEDFNFSVKNGCLEAVQCPKIDKYFNDNNIIDVQVVHTMKFNPAGYLTLSRLEFKGLTYRDPNSGEVFTLDDIYYSIENYGVSVNEYDVYDWISAHSGESKTISSRSLNWSFAINNGDYQYEKIDNSTRQDDFKCISDYMKQYLSFDDDELEIDNLYCEKNKEGTYKTPFELQPISASYIESLSREGRGLYGISDDSNYLFVIEKYPLQEISQGAMEGFAIALRLYNENGICEKEGFYFFRTQMRRSGINVAGYLESTNIFTK